MVLEYPFPHVQKAVMLALGNQCNDFGMHCFPSYELIQRHTSLSRRTVFEAISQLEEEGFLSRVPLANSQKVEFRIHVERLAQADLLAPTTSAPRAPVREAHQCGRRTSAAGAKTGAPGAPASAPGALHKAPVIYPKAPKGVDARARALELERLGSYDRGVIDPYLAELPGGIELQTFADFVKHRNVSGRVLSISAWRQVLQHLSALQAEGVDLNASLRETMALGLAKPVDPRRAAGRGRGPPRTSANDDFSTATYTGSDPNDIPAFLRNAAIDAT
jgi:hypothetical protein